MLMEMPVRPEDVVIRDREILIPDVVGKINTIIRDTVRYQKSGPFCCIDVDDIKKPFTDNVLFDYIIEEVKLVYKGAGWDCWEDTQPSGDKYLTFVSNIWRSDESSKSV